MTSPAELLLAVQLEQAGIPFVREYRFSPPRRWRFDFAWPRNLVALEIEGGSFIGGHKRGKAYESDCEKSNSAVLNGWWVFRVTPAMVDDGRALALLRSVLGEQVAA